MNSFGFYYNPDFLMCQEAYLTYYRLKLQEYEPPDLYRVLQEKINAIFSNSLVASRFEPLIHHSRLEAFFTFPEIKDAISNYYQENAVKYHYTYGYHFPFNESTRLPGTQFVPTFLKNLEEYRKLGLSSMIVHPSIVKDADFDVMVANLTDENFMHGLKKSGICLVIENMQEINSHLPFLVKLRQTVVDQWKAKGMPELSSQLGFCFDTGHFLIASVREGLDLYDRTKDFQEFGKYVKVFHIHTNSGLKDEHLIIRDQSMPLPPPKIQPNNPNHQQTLINNSKLILDWVEACLERNQYANNLEFLQEIDDYIDAPAMQNAARLLLERIDKRESLSLKSGIL